MWNDKWQKWRRSDVLFESYVDAFHNIETRRFDFTPKPIETGNDFDVNDDEKETKSLLCVGIMVYTTIDVNKKYDGRETNDAQSSSSSSSSSW